MIKSSLKQIKDMAMKWQWTIISILFLINHLALAEANLKKGKSNFQICISCHGANGAGIRSMNSPAINNQSAKYIARQLKHYKLGIRGGSPSDIYGAQMRGIAATLADDAINDVSGYIASLPTTAIDSIEKGDLHQGNNAYQSKCGVCHGGKAQGNPQMNAPALANLDSIYIIRQINNYKTGIRGSHTGDPLGKQMKIMANIIIDDDELINIIAYVHSIAVN
jgi:cytochrome c oxidase subunit 2